MQKNLIKLIFLRMNSVNANTPSTASKTKKCFNGVRTKTNISDVSSAKDSLTLVKKFLLKN